MKDPQTVKGSGGVRVTASGACVRSVSPTAKKREAWATPLSVRYGARKFVTKIFERAMSSASAALAAAQAPARPMGIRAAGTVRVAFSAAKLL
jgi:hypothetical protein